MSSIEPSLSEVMRDGIRYYLDLLHKAKIGKVLTYNPAEETVDVLPVVQRPIIFSDDSVEFDDICPIPDVPLQWPRSGGFYIHLPILPGDHVLLLFPDECIGPWRETGSTSVPGDLRRHSLSSAIAIPGIFPSTNPLSPIDAVARLAGMVLGREGELQQVRIATAGIELGANAVIPIALATPLLAQLANINTALVAIQASLAAIGLVPTVAAVGAVGTAITASAATVTAETAGLATATAATPSTMVRAL